MLDKALKGGKKYWMWIMLLGAVIMAGLASYLLQLNFGLGITGMGRNISWGLYISNFTFFVGIAASAVIVVLPYYLHDYKQFGKITVIGEFLAVSAVIVAILFIIVDLGQPSRAFNILRYPSPKSVLFWDMIVLGIYLILNLVNGWQTLSFERKSELQPNWLKYSGIISIPWAVSIHTVTAFIYSGLEARPFWLTALLAPRFLASAFASGPAILILVCFALKRFSGFDAGRDNIGKIAQIIAYAMVINIFFFLVEIFTAFYSNLPEHHLPFKLLFFGINGHLLLSPCMWASIVLGWLSTIFLLHPVTRKKDSALISACFLIIISIWIEKGLGLVVAGFMPSPLGEISKYVPTSHEIAITAGIYGIGLLILTILLKIAVSVKKEAG